MSTESEYVSTYAEQLAQEMDSHIQIPTHGKFRQVKGKGDPRKIQMAVLYDSDGVLIGSFPVVNSRWQRTFHNIETSIELELRDYT